MLTDMFDLQHIQKESNVKYHAFYLNSKIRKLHLQYGHVYDTGSTRSNWDNAVVRNVSVIMPHSLASK